MEATSEQGRALRVLRLNARLTIDDLAEVAQVSSSQISRVENGHVQPTPKWVARVTMAIGQTMAKNASRGSALGLPA
ncbi:helix-turn-helix domain-containing protein [Rhodococcus hoagii]|nr:helix-turn-helix domain-containing protein [Prescottella equi]MBM4527220.1 helix-turn-helix domain-containing protein [Prescottella equi]MBM4590201.1 helix-turn-helix domain-containing protein [Prescottella equi]MBM4652996.1 helix-turn-helix domain-containing protein [Prescottella equi]MBM4687734.1 helix-turn-helix domain-containing protein [Prescottella equi]